MIVRILVALALSASVPTVTAASDAARPLRLYWIDVEGGAATLEESVQEADA